MRDSYLKRVSFDNCKQENFRVVIVTADAKNSNRRLNQIATLWASESFDTYLYDLSKSNFKYDSSLLNKIYLGSIVNFFEMRREWKKQVIEENKKRLISKASDYGWWNSQALELKAKVYSFLSDAFRGYSIGRVPLLSFRDDFAPFITKKSRRRFKKMLRSINPNVIVFENYYSWLIANPLYLKTQILIYDAPEFATGSPNLSDWHFNKIQEIEKEIFSHIDYLTTISNRFKEKFSEVYSGSFGSIVYTNAPTEESTNAKFPRGQELEHILYQIRKIKEEGKKIILYHGNLIPDRNVIELADWFIRSQIDKWALVFMGDGPLRSELTSKESKSLILFPPVKADWIITVLKEADLCIVPYAGNCWNHVHCTPNKFFDAMLAKKPVIVNSALEQLATWVREFELGATFDEDFSQDLHSIFLDAQLANSSDGFERFNANYGWATSKRAYLGMIQEVKNTINKTDSI